MLTLFLMLLSPPVSPSPRVEDPRIEQRRILREEVELFEREALASGEMMRRGPVPVRLDLDKLDKQILEKADKLEMKYKHLQKK